jgi:hypothetical protein
MYSVLHGGNVVRSFVGHAIAQAVSRRRPEFEARSSHVGCVVDKVALGQVFPEYLAFPCQLSFHQLLHIHHNLSSGAGTVSQLVADVPSGLSPTPPHETRKNLTKKFRRKYPERIVPCNAAIYNYVTNYILRNRCWTKRNLIKDVLTEEKLDDIGTRLEANPKSLFVWLFSGGWKKLHPTLVQSC